MEQVVLMEQSPSREKVLQRSVRNDKKDEARLARELYCSVSAFSHFVVGESRVNNLAKLLK